MNIPRWLRPIGIVVAVLTAALLIGAALGVPYRAAKAPEGYEQSRLHWNTKNTTRFAGTDAASIAERVATAVYPATEPANPPDVVILYDPADWQGGLVATSLLRPLNAVHLPASGDVAGAIERLKPTGNQALNGTRVLLVNQTPAPTGVAATRTISPPDVPQLLRQVGASPRHAILVDSRDPATALLAAPWAAYSGDLVLFDPQDAPAGLPLYAIGNAPATSETTPIAGASPAETAVAFATFDDPKNPFFGWGMNAETLTAYRSYVLARPDDPATALLSANLAIRGKPGPLLWTGERELPQAVNNYLWSQRPAFWTVPNEGPFHHVFVLGGVEAISFPAQSQADYAIEIGPYRMKGPGLAGMDMLAAVWVALGAASAGWIALHGAKLLTHQNWAMRLAWPLLALMIGPFGIPVYLLAYSRPTMQHGQMKMWDRPLWLQGLVATVGSVGFGGLFMVATAYVMTLVGLPLIANSVPGIFWLGAPMVLVMIADYLVAVLVSWPLFQTPMLAMFHGMGYREGLKKALPIVLVSMATVSLAMFPGMWWLMMRNLPMMPTEESILWFGVMAFTVFLGFLMAWPFNYVFVRRYAKSGMM